MVMEVVPEEDVGVCGNHPYRNNATPGGICAFCLQEKLGTLLVSSSFRSDLNSGGGECESNENRSRFPFVSGQKKRNKEAGGGLYRRSKSLAAPRSEEEESSRHDGSRGGFWSFLVHVSKHSISWGGGGKKEKEAATVERLSSNGFGVESESRVRCSRILFTSSMGRRSKRWSRVLASRLLPKPQ
ncbi:hypothetical protein M569_01339 [Genlisea aurea]|uniref:Uncharacterized protein n=1 Tax=Genlisea aurea TaxID=192259 RepID=S8EBX9_9LAMI|nr:hypothetical protein M569_01339 [Genlisea aurea]